MPRKRSLLLLLLSAGLLVFLCCAGSRMLFQNEDQKFETFTDALFRQEVSSDAITLQYTLQHPADYGVEAASPTLGSYAASTGETVAAAENCLALLRDIPCQELNRTNRLTWRLLEDHLSQTLAGSRYALYEEPLSPLTGSQAQLPVLLSEYRIATAADADAYLKLLESIPEYFRSLIAWEEKKSDAGLFMASYTADAITEECESFLQTGSGNYLYTTFEDRIRQITGLSDSQKEDYISWNETAVGQYVFPSYRKLADAITKLRNTGKNQKGLCYLEQGASYYAYLVREETGSDRSIKELQKLIRAQIYEDLTAMQQVIDASSLPEFTLTDPEPAAILTGLKNHLADHFPPAPEVDTDVKYVPAAMENYLSPAFYMVPAIDNADPQTIYINSANLPGDLELFTTLAHEGYPGHLYQHVYFDSTNPAPIRSLLGCSGYTEGWATYAEMLSYYFTGLPSEQASLLQHNASVLLGLYALADMGIHSDGWALTDTVAFFREYGIDDADAVGEIYRLIVADPANYLKYYVGYLEFLELKKEAIRIWGDDFSQKRFHKAVLDAGPAPFYLLRDVIFEN